MENEAQGEDVGVEATPLGPNIYPEADDVLSHMVRIANMGVRQDVTLFVKGNIITGTLVSGRTYFENSVKIAEKARAFDGSNNAVIYGFKEYYTGKASIYVDPAAMPADHHEPDPGYIHLSNARFIVNGQYTTQKGLFWRGALTSVDGFMMGLGANG